MKFKNLREYLECYLKSDITLLADNFNNFIKIMFDEFQSDPVKYISAPYLSKDCALKYSKCKIENIKDVSIFNLVRKSVMGGLSNSVNPYIILDDIKSQTIAYNDISSQYPFELLKNYPFQITNLLKILMNQNMDKIKIMDVFYCHVKTTDKIRNDPLYKQCPMLVSRCKITDKNLSEYQLKQITQKRQNNNSNYNSQSEKIILNLGNDSQTYLNFEMYQMMKKAGYEISIKKILESKHKAIFKEYIEYLYSKKKQYSLQNKKSTEFIYKILINSFYGSTLTDKTRFRDIRICNTKRSALKFSKLPNYISMKSINENLIIIELSKKKCIFDSPIMIGSQVLFSSKCNLYNYMFNIIPNLFGRENITFPYTDTDSVIYKIENCPYEKYLKTLENNPNLFGKQLGILENEIAENINEVISLRSKSYSIQKVSDIDIKIDNNYKLRKSKGINNNYRVKFHTHEYFKKILFNETNMKKAEYYKISLKDCKLITELQIKDDINNFNDKMFMVDNLTSKPHEIYI